MEQTKSVTQNMTLGRKLGLLLDHLQSGGEIEHNGYTYVWCDQLITREEMNDQGQMQYFGIDGLALKCERIDGATGESSPHYIGRNDIPLSELISIIESLSEEDWFGITASMTLKSLAKKR